MGFERNAMRKNARRLSVSCNQTQAQPLGVPAIRQVRIEREPIGEGTGGIEVAHDGCERISASAENNEHQA